MNYPSLPQKLLESLARFPSPRTLRHKVGDRWESISSTEFLRRIAALSSALEKLGVRTGDRIALFSANRPEWHISDFAITGLGAVTVPIYFNESQERALYILNDSGAKIVIAVGPVATERILSVRSQLHGVSHIIAAAAPPETPPEVLRFESLIAGGAEPEISAYRRRSAGVNPAQLATLIYTSGTTGEPKGVMLTHANLTSNVIDTQGFDVFTPDFTAVSFLPLAHVYERTVDYGYLFTGVSIAYCDRLESVAQTLLEVQPIVIAAVPRFFEKIYANILETEHKVSGLKRTIYLWATGVARRAVPWKAYGRPPSLLLKLQWALADALAYKKIRARLGGKLLHVISGGAPLSKELAEFFYSVGIQICQGYGLTETSPIISSSTLTAFRVGSSGKLIRNAEVRIAEDGEIEVRGPMVMQGYYRKPEATREVLSEDGWFKTGDIGYLDPDGFLFITDRKKDLIKTAAGKFVAPQPIENRLKSSPLISNAVVIGDRRKYVVALIVPNFANLRALAATQNINFSSDAELAAHPWVHDRVREEIDRLTSHLAQYETIKRFAVLDTDFTFDGGQLTFTMKVKRRVIEQRYADSIEKLYTGEPLSTSLD